MKSEKGITLASLIIYVIAMTIAVGIIATLTTFFYNNIMGVKQGSNLSALYTKFNSFFTEDINITDNNVIVCGNDVDENGEEYTYIIFEQTNNQYTFRKDWIYLNNVRICSELHSSKVEYDENSKKITVTLAINENGLKTKVTSYKVVNY